MHGVTFKERLKQMQDFIFIEKYIFQINSYKFITSKKYLYFKISYTVYLTNIFILGSFFILGFPYNQKLVPLNKKS